VRLFTSLGWLLTRQRPFLTDQLRFRLPGVSIHWWREVWPMQWKIALSWVSGYFVFQLFNPVLFIYFGAVVAGQMGMSLALTTAVTTLAMSWISTKSPTFGQLIARRDYKLLDRIFSRTLLQAFFAAISCGVVLLLTVFVLYTLQIPLSQRVLDPLAFVLLTAVAIINVVVFAEAVYLRAHKQEPFLWISIAIAILSALSAYFLGRVYGAMGMAAGSFVIAVISLGVATWIFFVKRHDWHIVEK
jgi:O-antigen/teichoic acid export membrane protein